MSEFWRAALGIFAASAPFGVLPVFVSAVEGIDGRRRLTLAAAAPAIALALLAVPIVVGGSFLDWLDVSPQSFQLAVGAIMAPQALRLLWTGESASPMANEGMRPSYWALARAVPLLAAPPALVAALSYSSRFGEAKTAGAVVIAMALAAVVLALAARREAMPRWLPPYLGRLSGALLAIVAVEMLLDGLQSV